jgi:hypothetical protein
MQNSERDAVDAADRAAADADKTRRDGRDEHGYAGRTGFGTVALVQSNEALRQEVRALRLQLGDVLDRIADALER